MASKIRPRTVLLLTIAVAVLSISFAGGAAAQASFTVEDQTIAPDGGQINVSHNGADAYLQIDHSTLPANWTVERPDAAQGNVDETTWFGGVPNPAMITVIPDGEASIGETVEFTATIDDEGNQDTFNVTVSPDPISFSDQEIAASGGTVSVDSKDAESYVQVDLSNVPDGWEVTNPDPETNYNTEEIAWTSPAAETLSFDITPPDDVDAAGQSIEFTGTVDDSYRQDTFTVTFVETHESGVSQTVADAATSQGNDDQLDSLDILDAYSTYLETGEVNGKEFDDGLPFLDLYSWKLENS
ncbi:hypothetical protein HKK80_11270 [Halonotius sp. F2-221B]|uniref:hypothetical protein n=1 Tax=Halonotius sp. F2-221B TaxID=2731620 RepID=UPI00398A8019